MMAEKCNLRDSFVSYDFLHFFNKLDPVHCIDVCVIYKVNGLPYTLHITQIITNIMYE